MIFGSASFQDSIFATVCPLTPLVCLLTSLVSVNTSWGLQPMSCRYSGCPPMQSAGFGFCSINVNQDRFPAAAIAFIETCFRCAEGAHWVLPWKRWRLTVSQLDLPSLTQFYVTGWGGLLVGIVYWATAIPLPTEVVVNWPYKTLPDFFYTGEDKFVKKQSRDNFLNISACFVQQLEFMRTC